VDNIPFPEIVAALLISGSVLGIRAAWRAVRARLQRGHETVSGHASGHDENVDTRARLIASCVLLVIVSIPLILRLVPPNGIYGFRTGATMSSPATWYRANAFMGWALLIAAVVSANVLVLLPMTAQRWVLWATFAGSMAAAVALSFAYLNHL
jgi:hypothetical protein